MRSRANGARHLRGRRRCGLTRRRPTPAPWACGRDQDRPDRADRRALADAGPAGRQPRVHRDRAARLRAGALRRDGAELRVARALLLLARDLDAAAGGLHARFRLRPDFPAGRNRRARRDGAVAGLPVAHAQSLARGRPQRGMAPRPAAKAADRSLHLFVQRRRKHPGAHHHRRHRHGLPELPRLDARRRRAAVAQGAVRKARLRLYRAPRQRPRQGRQHQLRLGEGRGAAQSAASSYRSSTPTSCRRRIFCRAR